MPNTFSISIKNSSGAHKKYVIFSEPPNVRGIVSSAIWSNVMDVASTPKDQDATWTIVQQYAAVCGHSADKPASGISLVVQGREDVTLGSKSPGGKAIPGTSLKLKVEHNAPSFDKPAPTPASDFGAYQVVTGNEFTLQEATRNNYMIGLGAAVSLGGVAKVKPPAASFVPEPGTSYMIQPINVFYVSFGEFQKGTLINVASAGAAVKKIDFNALNKDDVYIVHDAHGNLNIQD